VAGKLTPKQERFVSEYLVDLNAVAAYRRAGYRAKTDETARSSASEILTNPNVSAAVAAAIAARSASTGITAEWALRRLKEEADFTGEGSSHSARVTAIVAALKHLGIQGAERLDATHKVGRPEVIEIPVDGADDDRAPEVPAPDRAPPEGR
jgi:phage terminase small subunit